MNDRDIGAAFDRLRSEVEGATSNSKAYRSVVGSRRRNRMVAPAAAAVVILVVVAGVALVRPPGGGEVATAPTTGPTTGPSTAPSVAQPPTTAAGAAPITDTSSATTVPGLPDNTVPGRNEDPGAGSTVPLATHRVANVAVDDVLNVRRDPDPAAPILAELPPTYAGIIWGGRRETAADGGVWYEVSLLDAVRLDANVIGEPLHGGPPYGWVNAAFLEPIAAGLPIDFDRLPCALSGGIGALTLEPEGAGRYPADHVYRLNYGADADCQRVVITLGSDYSPEVWELIDRDIRPADHLPEVFVTNEEWMTLTWSGLEGVWQGWQGATEVETPAGPVLVTRDERGSFSVVFTFPVAGPNYRAFPQEGRIVLDYRPVRETTLNTTERLVVVPPPAVIEPSDGVPEPIVAVDGWARPFEGTLHIELSRNGAPVEAAFSGSSFLGDVTATEYAVTTSTWADAWGSFGFQIAGLDPGSYELFLFSGGSDVPIGIRVPFTVP